MTDSIVFCFLRINDFALLRINRFALRQAVGLKACIYGISGLPPQKIAFSLHFLYRLLVILGSELIACVISYAVCGRRVSQ